MTKSEARNRCKTDALYLGQVLGYDFQEDVHTDLFAAFPKIEPGMSLRDLDPIKFILILWSRGHFKTSAVVVFIVQLILNYPDIRILIMQANLKLTKGWLREIKAHFTGADPKSKLKDLFPEFCAEKLGSAESFTVPARMRAHLKEATVTVASPRAIQTGQHYDFFFADDLVHAGNFRNIDQLDKLDNEFSHFIPLIDPGGYTCLSGTRYSHADTYGRVIARNKGEWRISLRTCFRADGSLLFPVRTTKDGRKIGFTPELLAQIQRDDPETFSAQYLNQIISAKNHLLPASLLLENTRSVQDKEYPAASPAIFVVDLAESKKVESDHSVIAVGKQDGWGRVWVPDVVGSTYSPFQLAVVLLQMTLKHRPVKILVEQAAGATYFIEYVRMIARDKGMSLPLDLLKVDRQKDAKYLRIASLESAFKQKRLLLCSSITDFERLSQEFDQFPRGRHDDRPDVIALLYKYLADKVPFTKPLNQARLLADILTRPNPITSDNNSRRGSPLGDTGFLS